MIEVDSIGNVPQTKSAQLLGSEPVKHPLTRCNDLHVALASPMAPAS